jgi:hypothetical protein
VLEGRKEMKLWRQIINRSDFIIPAARALLSAISIVIINSVAGPIETHGILEVARQWMSGLNLFLLRMSDYKF